MKSKVAIFGRGPDPATYALNQQHLFEFWGVNRLFVERKDVPWHRWFEIHNITLSNGEYLRKGDKEFRGMRIDQYLVLMGHLDIPVYMQDTNPYVPTSVKYPREMIVSIFGT